MTTLADKLAYIGGCPDAPGSKPALPPGLIQIWYLGAMAALEVLAEHMPDEPVRDLELRNEIAEALALLAASRADEKPPELPSRWGHRLSTLPGPGRDG